MKIRHTFSLVTLAIAVLTGCQSNNNTQKNETATAIVANSSSKNQDETKNEVTSLDYPASGFDLQSGMVELNSGYQMPILGIGTFRLSITEAENSVYEALTDGYRLIDTASIYGNEVGVGRGIERSGIPREEIFVTTKLWTDDFENGPEAIDESLERLGLEYVDLMILHHSADNDQVAYQVLEQAMKEGKVRSIGLSNYTIEEFDKLVQSATVLPAVLQNESHPYHQELELKEHLQQYGTKFEAWFPLGGRGNTQTLFDDPTIKEIAQNHNKTSAQVILRWHLQAGTIAIPGSGNPEHIQENFDIFDFELTNEEMLQMRNLERDERFASY